MRYGIRIIHPHFNSPRIFHPKIGKIFTPFNIFTPRIIHPHDKLTLGFFTPRAELPSDISPLDELIFEKKIDFDACIIAYPIPMDAEH